MTPTPLRVLPYRMDLEATLSDLAPRLLRYCVGRAGDKALGEEIAQDALMALVGRIRRHGPPDSAEAFAFTVARRRLGRALFKRRFTEPLEALFQGEEPAVDAEAQAVAKSDLARALGKIGELPRREREALLLVAAGELTAERAAEVLGIGTSALKMRVHRARKHLRKLLEDPTWKTENATTSTSTRRSAASSSPTR